MEEREFSGKTVEEALQQALAELGLKREEVEVTVVQRGRAGLLGLGAQEALVRVRPRPSTDVEAKARDVLEEILGIMRVAATVHPTPPPPGLGPPAPVALDIRGKDLGFLIGRLGQTLASLQYLVNVTIAHQLKSETPIWVDVEGYKRRRHENLQNLAQRLAEQVRRTGRSVTLEPMPPHERRVVHLALAQFPDLTTQSIGEGVSRQVVIQKRPVTE